MAANVGSKSRLQNIAAYAFLGYPLLVGTYRLELLLRARLECHCPTLVLAIYTVLGERNDYDYNYNVCMCG